MVVKSSLFFCGVLGLHTRLLEMPTPNKVGKGMQCDDPSIDVCVLYSVPQESFAEMIQQVKAEAEAGEPYGQWVFR